MKADLAIYSLVVGLSGLWVNVATMLNNKLDFYCCDNSVGFCKSSHIYILSNMVTSNCVILLLLFSNNIGVGTRGQGGLQPPNYFSLFIGL